MSLEKEGFFRVLIPIDRRAVRLEMDVISDERDMGVHWSEAIVRTYREDLAERDVLGAWHLEKRTFGRNDQEAIPYRVYDADNQIIHRGTVLVQSVLGSGR